MHRIAFFSLVLSVCFASAWNARGDEDVSFGVLKATPPDGAKGVELRPLIQVHTTGRFDQATVNERAVGLSDSEGTPVPSDVSADLGGVITLSPKKPLRPDALYRLRVTEALRSREGEPATPFGATFRTTSEPLPDPESSPRVFRFAKRRLDRRDGVCGLALAPGGNLFACTWDGTLVRYRLASDGSAEREEEILREPKRRFLSLVADPASTPDKLVLWLTHDSLARESLGPNDFSGTLSRIVVEGGRARREDWVVGLPVGDHPATGLVFQPDGKLLVSQGALTMLGDKPWLKETPLSAATLEIDLSDQAFASDRRPLDVRTEGDGSYDPASGPVRVYATGVREAYDLCLHSNGSLYAGVNMNDTGERTPGRDGLPSVSARPREMMIRIVRGKYYGHPNPSRGEWTLLGGNPTDERDPWEVPELPVGTQPDRNFDPALLIRDLEQDKGPSADGCCEWTRKDALEGRLIFCFYTATRGLHAYAFSQDGARVVDHAALTDESGEPLRFGAPLDVVFDPAGRLYVADFSAPERGDSGKEGGVWAVDPVEPLPLRR
ncbi:MAG TPA: Ig-like domain-containing protein [Pirellulaceae bacterium]|jgi:hypothetical protein|nr:Ig-like domain-containing protein [Pirellulaceae bacterium]